jgi:predicted chitinase
MFIAQCAHESQGFTKVKEGTGLIKKTGKWTGEKATYAPYYGRGFIQLTHETNYEKFSLHFFGDKRLVTNPNLLLQDLNLAAYASLWFWKYSDNGKRGLPEAANNGLIDKVTKLVNGGYNGIEERKKYFNKAISVLKDSVINVQWAGTTSKVKHTLWDYLTILSKVAK